MIDHQFLQRSSSVYRPLRKLEEWIDRSVDITLTSSKNAERILVDDMPTKLARLALIAATAQVLKNGLAILGVSAPDKM